MGKKCQTSVVQISSEEAGQLLPNGKKRPSRGRAAPKHKAQVANGIINCSMQSERVQTLCV